MFEIEFGELRAGQEFWDFRYECGSDVMLQSKTSTGRMYVNSGNSYRSHKLDRIVFIKEKQMTDKEQAQVEVDAIKVKLAKLEEIINKPDRIKVPDCIDILSNCNSVSILFNGRYQKLGEFGGRYHVQVSNHGYTKNKNLYLEPCKREDLKPGDVAYMSDSNDPDFGVYCYYHCVLSDNEYAYVAGGDSIDTGSSTWRHCWKVVK